MNVPKAETVTEITTLAEQFRAAAAELRISPIVNTQIGAWKHPRAGSVLRTY